MITVRPRGGGRDDIVLYFRGPVVGSALMGPAGGKHGCDRAPRQDNGFATSMGSTSGYGSN